MCTWIFSALIFNLLQNCLHPDFHYVHLSVSWTPIPGLFFPGKWTKFPRIGGTFLGDEIWQSLLWPFCLHFSSVLSGKVNQISANRWHFPGGRNLTIASTAILPAFLVRSIRGKWTVLPRIRGTFPAPLKKESPFFSKKNSCFIGTKKSSFFWLWDEGSDVEKNPR